MPQTVPRSDVTHLSGRIRMITDSPWFFGEGVLSLLEKDPSSPWDVGRRDPDTANDRATIRVVP
ncbi:hypothetical protein ACIRP7_03860 [Streptomyces sp. NPDC102270]|uniref:hypothetical protein n=1 Tax=Streptomyces sp. NPDC102270 TaxID=3366150 RepID=UPI00382ADCCF